MEYRTEVKAGDNNLRGNLFSAKVVLFLFYEMGSCFVAQAGLELIIFLPPIPECWEHRYLQPHLTWEMIFKVMRLNKSSQCVIVYIVLPKFISWNLKLQGDGLREWDLGKMMNS